MNTGRFQGLLPIAGILFSVLLVVGLVVTFNQPSDTDSAQKVFAYWTHHKNAEIVIALVVIHLSAILLVFFGAGLRAALRSGEAEEASYSSIAFGGAILAAAGFGIVAMLSAATANAADRGSLSAVYTIHQISSMDWLAWTPGLTAMLLASGLGGLRTTVLPKSMSWSAIVIGAAFLTPAGEFALLALPVWTLATSVALARQTRRGRAGLDMRQNRSSGEHDVLATSRAQAGVSR